MAKRKPKKKSVKRQSRRNTSPVAKIAPNRDSRYDSLLDAVRRQPNNVAHRLILADYCLHSGREAEIVAVLSPLEAAYPFEDFNSNRVYNRRLAFGYANDNRLVDAEDVCRRGMENEPDGLDYQFVMCFVHLSLREFVKAIDFGKKYLSLRENRAGNNGIDFSAGESHLSQVYNFVGSAHFERSEWEQAKEQFEKSRRLDPGNHLPYLNLANIARHQGDKNAACSILEQGLKSCRQIQELRLLAQSLLNSVTISACMIVKNEEELLPECLVSIRDWVDEIIVVDTGSTDRTVEIAESYGAKVYHQPWEGNFSKHRNYSVDLATSEWVFIIDADERFEQEDIPEIRRLLHQDEVEIVSINVYNVYGQHEELTTFLPSVRFWRRKVNLRYEGIVHNLLKLGEEHPVVRSGARIKHLGYGLEPEKMAKKFMRTKTLLEKQLEENPDNFFALFNYAQLLKGEGLDYPVKNIPVIIESASRAVELTDPANKAERHVHLMCLDQIAWAHFFNKDYDESLSWCERAIELKPNYLDPLMLKGHIYANRQEWDKAKDAYWKYIETQKAYNPSTEADCLILTHVDNRAAAYYGLALIAEIAGDVEEAKNRLLDTVEAQPHYMEANLRLGRIHLDEGDYVKARERFTRQLGLNIGRQEAALGLATIAEREKDNESAEKHFQAAIEMGESNFEPWLKYGQYLLNNGRHDEAVKQIKKAVSLGADSRSLLMKLADIYFQSGQLEEAKDTYLSILESHGESSELLNNIGNCHFGLGQFELAEDYYRRSLGADNPLNLTYRNLGLTLARLEKYSDAAQMLGQYASDFEKEPELAKMIADLHSKSGDFEKALDFYERFLAKRPSDPAALFGLSECYLHMGHRDSASLGYRKVLELKPDFEPARSRLESLSQATETV